MHTPSVSAPSFTIHFQEAVLRRCLNSQLCRETLVEKSRSVMLIFNLNHTVALCSVLLCALFMIFVILCHTASHVTLIYGQ